MLNKNFSGSLERNEFFYNSVGIVIFTSLVLLWLLINEYIA